MKKIILFLLLYSLNLNLLAQPYKSVLGDSIARWSVRRELSMDGVIGQATDELATSPDDTIINSLKYKKIYAYSVDYDANNTNPTEAWKIEIISFQADRRYNHLYLRETEDAAKLYLLDTTTDKEIVVMDLTLEKGDSCSIFGDKYAVDSVYYIDKRKHIRFANVYVWPNTQLEFIEGVGTNVGPIDFSLYDHRLICFQNKTDFYKAELFDCHCGSYIYIYDANLSGNEQNLFTYSVSNGELILLFDQCNDYEIKIYQLSGQLIKQGRYLQAKKIIVPLTSISSGIYLITVNQHSSVPLIYHFKILL